MTTMTQHVRTGGGAPLSIPSNAWTENDSVTNSQANPTKAAEAGRRHVLTGVTVGVATAKTLVRVKVGSTVVWGPYSLAADAIGDFVFWPGIEAAVNESISAEVDAAGAGNDSTATIHGYTVED